MDPRREELKAKLLTMASQAEAAVNQAVRALLRRDDDLALRTKEDDRLIDTLEVEIDGLALRLLPLAPSALDLRQITTTIKVARDLERVGDEATTISRRTLALVREPRLRQVEEIPRLAGMAIRLLKEALDSFVQADPVQARGLIPKDHEMDALYRAFQKELVRFMSEHPEAIERCLDLLVIAKSLERIADHATNVAEMVVYMCEGIDIRHSPSEAFPTP